MYICFIRESHEPWTYCLIFFIIFLLSCHHFSSYLIVYILCLCHHISFYVMNDDLSHFSAWRTVMSFSTPISWTLVRRFLIEKVILLEKVHVHHYLRVYPFHNVFSVEFICLIFRVYEEKKRNKRMYLCMYIVFFSIECKY